MNYKIEDIIITTVLIIFGLFCLIIAWCSGIGILITSVFYGSYCFWALCDFDNKQFNKINILWYLIKLFNKNK